jgi:hypothetical protein
VRDVPPPTVYIPYRQLSVRGITFEVRAAGDPSTLVPAIREAVRHVDPTLPVIDLTTQTDQTETRFANERVFALSFSIFGALAAVLASIGLFGTVSYNVARRTNEMGIRLAIGAKRSSVIGLVLKESIGLVLIGTAIGLTVAAAAGRLIRSLLFGLNPVDGVTFALVTLLMITISLLATCLPAIRASRVDPINNQHSTHNGHSGGQFGPFPTLGYLVFCVKMGSHERCGFANSGRQQAFPWFGCSSNPDRRFRAVTNHCADGAGSCRGNC